MRPHADRSNSTKAGSTSRSEVAFTICICSPSFSAVALTSRIKADEPGLVVSTSKPIAVALGTISRSSSSRFRAEFARQHGRASDICARPVQARNQPHLDRVHADLENDRDRGGCRLRRKRRGNFPPVAAMTLTRRRISSAANSGRRPGRPSAQRYSMATFWPSIYPALAKPSRKARTRLANGAGEAVLRNPTTGIAACACANNGHAAAPPKAPRNSRRRMFAPGPRTSIVSAQTSVLKAQG